KESPMHRHASPAAASERSDIARLALTSVRQQRLPFRRLRLVLLIAANLFLVTLVLRPAPATPVAFAQHTLLPAPRDRALIPGKPALPQATSTTISVSPP